MAKILKAIWWSYAVAGAVWLTFTLFSVFYFHRPTIHNIDGVVEQVIAAEWDGFHDDIGRKQGTCTLIDRFETAKV